MAKKSTPTGFSKGLISDTDPRYQIEGSYRDAMNIKLVNSDGATFTIENINGNKKVVDLDAIDKYFLDSYIQGGGPSSVPNEYFKDLGGFPSDVGGASSTGANNSEPMRGAANIVGHYSFRNQLFLIVCGYIGYDNTWGSQSTGDFRTAFFLLDFDDKGEVLKCTDLRVAYNPEPGTNRFPNLNMDPLIKCRVEGIIENEGLTRVYWTDNKNPLRTLNLKDPDIHDMDPVELDITPKSNHNQGVAVNMTSGSLPSGVYQYCYKYVTETGAESGISPFSNMYHISNANSASYTTYFGGPSGQTSTDGFEIKFDNLDTRFDRIRVYALYYSSLGVPPLVGEVRTADIGLDGTCDVLHAQFSESIEDGIAQVLIPSNTWDICKDIAIKDNVLFAANLRSKKNYITEKEWNVKIRRWDVDLSSSALTCDDSSVKDYFHPNITGGVDYDLDTVTEAGSSNTNYISINKFGNNYDHAHRYLPTMGKAQWGNHNLSTAGTITGRKILGGVSYGYHDTTDGATETNGLGGVQVSFRMEGKVSDSVDNRGGDNASSSVFFSANTPNNTIQTDNRSGVTGDTNVDTEYVATLNMGSNKDPMASGSKRGYQRGETYRFGVLIYDKNGDPGNVLWIGDIQMPDHHDKAWQLDFVGEDNNAVPTQLGEDAASSLTKWRESSYAQDYRMSANGSSAVPGAAVHYDNTACTTVDVGATFNQGSDNGKRTAYKPANSVGEHVTLDLAVDFTFKIPAHVRKKISGFRVVRAERKETDRTIVQSGILNDIIHYGRGSGTSGTPRTFYPTGPESGYVGSEYETGSTGTCNSPMNIAVGVEANDHAGIAADNVDEIYDQVLNGYSGLDATSASAIGANSSDETLYLLESDGSTGGNFHAGSREFGSRELGLGISSTSSYVRTTNKSKYATVIYSPDSTFGVRPYSHRGESWLRICSTMKLYDQRRYNYDYMQEYPTTSYAQSMSYGFGDPAVNNSGTAAYGSTSKHVDINFYSKKTTLNDESGVMVGKCYVYDTYFQHYVQNYDTYNGLTNSSGPLYVNNHRTVNHSDLAWVGTAIAGNTTPSNDPTAGYSMGSTTDMQASLYQRYTAIIKNSKEIGPGEFVGKSFFDIGSSQGDYHLIWNRGYSNFSLGVAFQNSYSSWRTWFNYGKVNTTDDLSYETISTVQMGTRSILTMSSEAYTNVRDIGYIITNQDYYTQKSHRREKDPGNNGGLHANHKLPFYNYANIYVDNIGQYGGRSKSAIDSTRWIIAGNYHPINDDIAEHHSTVFGGDTFVNLYSHQITTSPYPEKSYSKFIVFPVESYINTDMRGGYNLGNNDHIEGFDQDSAPFSNDWLYNQVYSQENNLKSFLSLQDTDQDFEDLPNEIAYSKTKLSGELSDAFRVFPIFNFYDVEAIYGPINRLINYNNEIHFFQDNAFGQLLVNPRTFLQDTSGAQSLFTGSGDTIESHQYISVKYGSRHMHSVVASERNLYFFDVNFSKFLKYGVDKKLVSISDDLGTRDLFEKATKYGRLKIQDRYHKADRINLNDMPLNFIGIHAAFDYFDNTLYMTFADRLRIDYYDSVKYPNGRFVAETPLTATYNEGTADEYQITFALGTDPESPLRENYGGHAAKSIFSTTVAYNEDIEAVISRYSVYPQQWIEHQGKLLTPKSRLPWMQYSASGDLRNRFYHNNSSSNSVFGSSMSGVYGAALDFKYNPTGYRYFSHELSRGSLELWEWNHEDAEKTTFFDDVFLHPFNNDFDQSTTGSLDNTIDLPIEYPLVFEVITTDGALVDDDGNYNGGLKLLDLGNADGTAVEFYNASGTAYGQYNTTTEVITITNTSTVNKGDLLKSKPTLGQAKIVHQSYVEKIINDSPQENKKFDNLSVVMSVGEPNPGFKNQYNEGNRLLTKRGFQSTDAGVYLEKLEFITDFAEGKSLDISTNDRPVYPSQTDFKDTLHKYREGILRIPLRYKLAEGSNPRLSGTYLRAKLSARTTEKFNIFAIMAKYRKSYN